MTVAYPLRLFFDCSNAHLSPASRSYLERECALPESAAAATTYGWFVWAEEEPVAAMPADLAAIMAYARSQGAEYILFDRDAAVSDALPTFSWES